MPNPRAILVVDLAFGDCGKGSIVDFLVRHHDAHTVVRFNGGPQAAHNVVTPDGRHHTFAQFGSGTFIPGVRTLLSRFVLIEPYALLNEAAHLRKLGLRGVLDRLFIDARSPVITPFHLAANRLRELARGFNRHGSCGMGIGETQSDCLTDPDLMLRAGELGDPAIIRRKLLAIRDLKLAKLADVLRQLGPWHGHEDQRTLMKPTSIDAAIRRYAQVAEGAHIIDASAGASILNEPGATVFEGAQGVLLDERFGFHPHTTWSTTTFTNADTLLDECEYAGDRHRLGVLRTYFTRHGQGPFPTDDAKMCETLLEAHNNNFGFQGTFRVGAFDAVAARYALTVCGGVDGIALTHVDRIPQLPREICTAYYTGRDFAEEHFERCGGLCVNILPATPSAETQPETLARALYGVRPHYVPTIDGHGGFIETIEMTLHTPITLLSAGPTAGDKRWRNEPTPRERIVALSRRLHAIHSRAVTARS